MRVSFDGLERPGVYYLVLPVVRAFRPAFVPTFLALAMLMSVARTAPAQTCAGAMSFNFAPLQVGGAPEWSHGGRAATASVAVGSDRLFSSFSTGLTFSGADQGRVGHAAVAVGTDQPLTLNNRLHVCPVATVTYARRQGRGAAGAGGHVIVGWVARNGTALAVLPSAGVGVRQIPGGGPDADPLQQAVELQAAVGFILSRRVALRPRAAFGRGQPARVAVEVTIDAR